MSKRLLPFLPLLLLPLIAARNAEAVQATALGEGARETVMLDSINRLKTSRGTLKVDLHQVERIYAMDEQVRVYFLDGDVASGELKHPLFPEGATWLYVQAEPPEREEPTTSPIVAWVDGKPVLLEELQGDRRWGMMEPAERLEQVIEETLIHQAALAAGMAYSPKVKKLMVAGQLRRQVYSQLDSSQISDAELLAYFEANQDLFVIPKKRQLRSITWKLGPTRDLAAAQALCQSAKADIDSDEAFKQRASTESEDPYRRRGGDLGFVSLEGKAGVPTELLDAAWQMDTRQMACVETPNSVVLLRIGERREQVSRTFEQMKGSVMRRVKNEHYQALYESYVADLRADVAVEIDADVLREMQATGAPLPGLGGKSAPK
jgi:hypothetical protein